ncbi:MAG: hypothetical protein EKK48_28115 [Candidatus Melainabacteria bacterium]|jgi:hypothetical protein|nr:MAG: hypothetical protein EKK48_28115 [Candidatus Melainabacteria bacterium]
MHPADFQTSAVLFIAIVLGYLVLSLFVLGGKKVYFEPFVEKDEPTPAKDSTQASASTPPTL